MIKPFTEDDTGKVTCMVVFPYSDAILFGSEDGYLTIHSFEKRQVHLNTTFILDKDEGLEHKAIIQIEELPQEVLDARNHVYYVLTRSNLYCLSKVDNSIMQTFYKKK